MARPVRLEGESGDGYIRVLRHLLEVARPGAHYPDPRNLDAHLSFLGPEGSFGVSDGVGVDPNSGLPSIRQLLRVRADRDLAAEWLAERPDSQGRKARYYGALLARELLPTSSVDVRLRARRGPISELLVVHDRIDAASGYLLRYTFLLRVRGGKHVGFTPDELPEPKGRFLTLMERHSGADAEVAFLLLSDIAGVTVEEVVRGQIGPLSFAGLENPDLLRDVIDEVPGTFILHLTLERAGETVPKDHCRDPFGRLYRETLSPESREPIERTAAELGYHVSKERRLICTRSAEAPLKQKLAKAGVRLVVRST